MTVDDSKRQGIQEIVSGKTMSLLCITAKKRQLATFFMYTVLKKPKMSRSFEAFTIFTIHSDYLIKTRIMRDLPAAGSLRSPPSYGLNIHFKVVFLFGH